MGFKLPQNHLNFILKSKNSCCTISTCLWLLSYLSWYRIKNETSSKKKKLGIIKRKRIRKKERYKEGVQQAVRCSWHVGTGPVHPSRDTTWLSPALYGSRRSIRPTRPEFNCGDTIRRHIASSNSIMHCVQQLGQKNEPGANPGRNALFWHFLLVHPLRFVLIANCATPCGN